ncbi:hypothetical protein DB345_20820 [Spartobacteria bacterium LR76]|nr:hypothetical protein DB345_20820 [Spartobacteria bacterium LR76]
MTDCARFAGLYFLVLFAVGGVSQASAQSVSYIGANNGSWFTPGNWDSGTVPTKDNSSRIYLNNSSTARIDSPGATAYELGIGDYNGAGMVDGGLIVGSGGTLSIERWLYVGAQSNGTFSIIDGGQVSANYVSQVGAGGLGNGRLTVSGVGSMFSGSLAMIVGSSGAEGFLTVENGGKVDLALALRVGEANEESKGHLNLNSGGLLKVAYIEETDGQGTIDWDGGVLQARQNESNFLRSFEAGDVTLGNGGGTIDTNGFDIGISSVIDGTGALTKIGAGTLTVGATNTYQGGTTITGGLVNFSSLGSFGSGNITLNGGGLQWAAATTDDVSARLNAIGASGGTFDTNGNDVTLATALTGSGALTKAGGGVLAITADGSYSGKLTIGAGTFQIGNGGATGNFAGDIENNSALTFNRTGSLTYSSVLSGTGTMEKKGTGTLILAGANTMSGSATVSGGVLQIGDGGTNGQWNTNITNNASVVFARSDDSTYGSVISGSGTVTKQGAGVLTLTKDQSYTGATTISEGTLRLGNGGVAGTLSGSVTNNGILAFNRSDSLTFSNTISGTGGVKLESGTLTLNGANTFTGGAQVTGGTLIVGSSGALGVSAYANAVSATGAGSKVQVNSGVTLSKAIGFNDGATLDNRGTVNAAFGSSSSGAAGGTLINTGAINASSWSAAYIQDGIGTVTNTGGTLKGTGSGNYGVEIRQGGTVRNESAGTIQGDSGIVGGQTVSGDPALSATTVQNVGASTIKGSRYGINLYSGGTVTNDDGSQITGQNNVGVYVSGGSGSVSNLGTSKITGKNDGVLLASGGSVLNEGTITGTNAIRVQNSSLATLTNKGTLTGNVSLSNYGHTVQMYSGSKITGNLNMGTSSSAKLELNAATDAVYSVVVTGTTTFSGVLKKLGSATWTLDKNLTGVASTDIQAGTLKVNSTLSGSTTVRSGAVLGGTGTLSGAVTVENGATIAAGNSPGVLTVGSLDLGNASLLNYELGNPGSDRIDVSGALNLDGILNVVATTGFGAGTYRLFNYGSLINDGLTFGSIAMPFEYELDFSTPGQVNLIVTAAAWQYWDDSQTAPNGAIEGGTGTWDATTTNWTSSTGNANAAWNGGAVGAVFKGAGGTVTIADGATITTPAMSFQVDGYTLAAAGTGNLQLSGDGVIEVFSGASTTISAKITSGQLDKRQGGTLVLSAANTYAGGTTISAGIISAKNDSALGTGAVAISDGATLSVDTAQLAIGALSGAVGAQVILDNGNALGIDVASGISTFAGNITGGLYGFLVKLGSGTQVLSGNNTFAGQVDVFGGELIFASNSALSASAYLGAQSGQATIDGVELTVAQLIGSTGSIVLDGGSLTLGGANAANTFGGAVSGTGALIMDGGNASTQTLSGANGYSGGTMVKSGTLALSGNGSLLSTGALSVDTNGTFNISGLSGASTTVGDLSNAGSIVLGAKNLIFGAGGDTTLSGSITGTGGLTKQGAGTVRVTSAHLYSGGTTVNAGVLETANTAALGTGALTLGGNGTVALAGGTTLSVQALTWQSGGTFRFSLGSVAASTSYVSISSLLSQGGAGVFSFTDGGFQGNTTYDLLTFDSTSAVDASLFTANLVSGLGGIFAVRDNGDGTSTLTVRYSGSVQSNVINNDAPDWTPRNADFLVNGNVQSLAGNQRVNSLTFGNGASVDILDLLQVTSGQFNVPEGFASISGGTLFLPDVLTKLGAGQLNLLGNVLANGNGYVQDGTLSINGVLQLRQLIVQFGAILKGAGTIIGGVLNQGTVAPGNSPGTLAVAGNFTQTSTGDLQIEVASMSVFDQLVVTGTASLDGTLAVQSYEGFQFAYGQQFNFLHAGNITGSFDSITMPDPEIFRGRFLSNGTTGTLLVAPASYTLVAETQNQRNVARALDSYIPATSGDREAVSIALDLQTAEQYPAAFDAIAPGYYETLTDTTIEQATAQSQFVAQRLSAVRLGARGFQAIGIEVPLVNDRNGKNVLDAKDGKDLFTPSPNNKWGVWALGNGVFSKVTSVSQIPNYRFQGGGFLVGADYAWSENFATGVFGGYQGTYAKYGNGSMSSVNSALFGGYATYQKEGFYSDAVVSGGYNGYIAKRAIQFSTIDRTARANPDGGQFSTYLDAGYDWQMGGFTFGPLLSAQYTYAGIAPFSETGADSLDLRVEQQNANSLRTNVGGRIAYTWNAGSHVVLIPEVRMFWQHEYLQNSTAIGASLDGGAGDSFDYMTTVPGRDSVFAGAGVSAQFGEDFNAFVYYNTDFGRQDYLSQMISTGLGWKF